MTLKPLYPHPAALITRDGEKHLLISDLHIGFEESFHQAGVNLEASIEEMLKEALSLIKRHKPDRLIILGDVKHSVDTISALEWRYVPEFIEKVSSKVEVVVIPGNHDGNLAPLMPSRVRVEKVEGILIEDTGLLHGHTAPSKALASARRLAMGHIHPTFRRQESVLAGRQVWLLLKVSKNYVFKGRRGYLNIAVLPSFNRELAKTGFQTTYGRIISPILRRVKGMVHEALITTLEGEIVGDVNSISYLL